VRVVRVVGVVRVLRSRWTRKTGPRALIYRLLPCKYFGRTHLIYARILGPAKTLAGQKQRDLSLHQPSFRGKATKGTCVSTKFYTPIQTRTSIIIGAVRCLSVPRPISHIHFLHTINVPYPMPPAPLLTISLMAPPRPSRVHTRQTAYTSPHAPASASLLPVFPPLQALSRNV
jgi:hypothetical protein